MKMTATLTAEQELQARQLADRLQQASAETLLQMSRTLVGTTDATLFGATEFVLRDMVLTLVARAYEQHLQKKTATTTVDASAPIVANTPPTTATANAPC